MRYPRERKQQTEERMVVAAGKQFRAAGFGGAGVDALAREAGLTSGAFYKHFPAKADAFTAVVARGFDDFVTNIERVVASSKSGEESVRAILDYYFGDAHLWDLAASCVVPGLTADVARADEATRRTYHAGIDRVIAALSGAMPDAEPDRRRERAWLVLAILSSGVQFCRAIGDRGATAPLVAQFRENVRSAAGYGGELPSAKSSPEVRRRR